ncbi:hypothetical protein PCASD_14493 [Puccinia coronata f. sp. avenae]|uniref:Uncharacterized protein n=1 Tax=Puccinia coronata f. sp. avenae TaxID=200324 RepID=A0A2N5TEY1_9BASI|nr:hypothetical protein PCASD_14493 [Puccinia coronata f. sp. avenae]
MFVVCGQILSIDETSSTVEEEFPHTAGINRSNTAVRAVLKQPCLTGGWTGTVQPKQEPTGRTDLSDRSRLVLCDRSQELIGQACPTRRQVLCSSGAQTAVFDWLMPAVQVAARSPQLLTSPRLRVPSSTNFASNEPSTAVVRELPQDQTTVTPPLNHQSGAIDRRRTTIKPQIRSHRTSLPLSKTSARTAIVVQPVPSEHDAFSTAQIKTPQLLRTGLRTLNEIDDAGLLYALFVSQATCSLRATRTIVLLCPPARII